MPSDLTTNLLKGYAQTKDKVFCKQIQIKKLEYSDETFYIYPNCLDFMELVQNYYKDVIVAKE